MLACTLSALYGPLFREIIGLQKKEEKFGKYPQDAAILGVFLRFLSFVNTFNAV